MSDSLGLTVPEQRRFFDKIAVGDECWEWTAKTSREGYGHFSLRSREYLAHRISYEYFVGTISDGLTIDHLCRNPGCVRPDHLEAVTMRENVLRGDGPTARNARKTHCIHGHPFDEKNTHLLKDGRRHCRACCNARKLRAYYARKKVCADRRGNEQEAEK